MSLLAIHIEKELFLQIAAGNEIAFREIFYRYGSIIRPFIFGIVKDDDITREIIQEVFLRVWLKRETFPAIENPTSWIYRIASNLAFTHFRKQQLEKKVLQTIQNNLPHSVDDSSDMLYGKELESLIDQATQTLSPLRKKIFYLSREQGLSRKEIAHEFNISENTVRNQLAIAVRSIRFFIQKATKLHVLFVLLFFFPQ